MPDPPETELELWLRSVVREAELWLQTIDMLREMREDIPKGEEDEREGEPAPAGR